MPRFKLTREYSGRWQHRPFALSAGDEVKGEFAAYLWRVNAPVKPIEAPALTVTFDDLPRADALRDAGYETLADVRAATDAELDAVDGIGRATIAEIRETLG